MDTYSQNAVIVVLTLCTLLHVPSLELLSTFILLWNWGSGMWIYSTKVIQNYERNSGLPQKWTSLESLSVRMLVLSETQRKKKEETHFLVLNTLLVFTTVRYFRSFTTDLQIKGDYRQNWISGISFYLLIPFLFKLYRVKRTQQTFHRRSWVEDKQYERKEP